MEYYNRVDETLTVALKRNVLYPVIKVELMNYQERVLKEITQDISEEENGSISVNYQQGIRRSCSITLINSLNDYTPNANQEIWFTSKFKVYVGYRVFTYKSEGTEDISPLLYEDNNKILYQAGENNYIITEDMAHKYLNYIEENYYWFSQGVYILTNPNVLRDFSNKTVTLNGIDKFGMFTSDTNYHELEGTYLVPYKTPIKDVITDTLKLNIGNGQPADPKPPIIDLDIGVQVLPYDIEKSPNSYWADILIEIANVYSCDIYYDTEGYLHFEKGNTKENYEDLSTIWKFSELNNDYFSPNLELNFTDVYNVIKVIGNNSNAAVYEAIARNNDPASPTAIQLIGEKIKYIESSFCTNQARTQDYADYLLRKNSIVGELVSFQSIKLPFIDVNKVIELTDQYFNYKERKFIIQSLTIPLTTEGLMEIQCSNISNIPYYTE